MAKDDLTLFLDDDPLYYEDGEYDTGFIQAGQRFYTHCNIDGVIYKVTIDEQTNTPTQGSIETIN